MFSFWLTEKLLIISLSYLVAKAMNKEHLISEKRMTQLEKKSKTNIEKKQKDQQRQLIEMSPMEKAF